MGETVHRTQAHGDHFVFDCQAHIVRQPISDGRFGMPDVWEVSQLINLLRTSGVAAALVSPVATPYEDYRSLNEEILEAQSAFAGIVYACPRIQPLRGADLAAALVQEFASAGARAFKLDPFRDSAYAANDFRVVEPVVGAIAQAQATLLVDSSEIWVSRPGLMAEVAGRFPTLPIILGHSGGIWENHDEALAVARTYMNVYLDTSRVWPPAFVAKAVAEIGAQRVIFGSDSPPSQPRWELNKITRYAGLTAEETREVVGGNLARLIGLT